MNSRTLRRGVLVALAAVLLLGSALPAEAASPRRKLEPRRVVPYRVGHRFTPNTNVLSVSGYAAWMIDEVLGEYTPLPPLGKAFMAAEREQGINARYFVAHAMLESGWGGSAIALRKKNLFGYNALDRDPWKHAKRFASHAKGIAFVAAVLRKSYLTPGGRRWHRFPTLRAINMHYASDPRWASKVANLANGIDGLVVTLKERWLRFRRPELIADPMAGSTVTIRLPWRAKPGAVVPPGIRFAVRWVPLAVVETASVVPTTAPPARWRLAARRDRRSSVIDLQVPAPPQPGRWRLELEARDSDGRLLPETDRPAIPSLEVRVVARGEIELALAVNEDGTLAAIVQTHAAPVAASTAAVEGAAGDEAAGGAAGSSAGAGATAAAGAAGSSAGVGGAAPGTSSDAAEAARGAGSAEGVRSADTALTGPAGLALEVWALPLDPSERVRRLARQPLDASAAASAPPSLSVAAPPTPAVVVARLVGAGSADIRAVPAVLLVGRGADGRPRASRLAVASPRDDVLLARQSATGGVTLLELGDGGALAVDVPGDDPPEVDGALVAAEGQPGSRVLLVRSIGVEPGREAEPTSTVLPIDGAPGGSRLTVTNLPGGVRFVLAGIVPRDGGPVDPTSVTVAWIQVAVPTAADPVLH